MVEPARALQQDFKPHLFGKFFVLQRLAVGGMAEVYRAKVVGAAGFEKELALKRILAARAQDHGFIKMLVNEAKLTAQLTHSNIAQIYECGEVEGSYFISMELVYGVSMKEMMAAFARAGTTLTPEQSIFIVLQLLLGLDYAHRKTGAEGEPLRIVHCDVSPDNALVSWEGELKLLDFGIARAATGLSNYKEGMLMGKLGYVAPEQASLETRWDHRVDLFAAGILLYELLTRQKPFPRATDVESLVASRKAKVPRPSAIDDRIPGELDAILARALAVDPDDRYPSARAFSDALVDVLFPTPHSVIQDLLAKQMRQVFADRILRQRAARSHDALVQKVLQHVLESEAASAPRLRAAPDPPAPAPVHDAADAGTREKAQPPAPPPPRLARARRQATTAPWKLAGVAAAAAVMASAATWAAIPLLRPGTLVVTSDPPGARIALDGQVLGTPTPAVLDDVSLARGLSVTLSAHGRKSVTVPVEPEPGTLVRRVHARLPASTGSIVVQSEPSGAEVRLDGRRAGVTPLTVDEVRLDERHRLDLVLAGHELDQLVFLPERDGLKFVRKLVPSPGHGHGYR